MQDLYSNRYQKAKDINNDIPPKFCSSCSNEIFTFYGIDVNQDDDKDIFQKKICSVCFEKMKYGLKHDNKTVVKYLGEKGKGTISVHKMEASSQE